MSEKDHIITNSDPRNLREGGFGSKFNENYSQAYAASPIHSGDMTDDKVRQAWVEGVQTGDSTDAFTAYGVGV